MANNPIRPNRSIKPNFKLTLVLYSLILVTIVIVLKIIEYRFIIHDLTLDVYLGAVALISTIVGIGIGLRIVNSKKIKHEASMSTPLPDEKMKKKLGISRREYEVLQLISKGYSNQEIADELFISLPTVKTHSSKLFVKLNVQRRTQAVKKAKDLKLIH